MSRRSVRSSLLLLAVLLAAAIAVVGGCGKDKPTTPADPDVTALAGGGRLQNADGFSGGPEAAGPGLPDFEPANPDFWPLFYAELDCRATPGELLIATADAWQAWWTEATACLAWHATPPLRAGGDPENPDDPGEDPWSNPYPDVAPAVDFASHVVLVVALEPHERPGRSVWVQDLVAGVVHYQVTALGDDCFGWYEPEFPSESANSPTIAVLAPRPDTETLTWNREDFVYDCSWAPDPLEPIALYYTDTACDLGPATAVLRDAESLAAWLDAAVACDEEAWSGRPGWREGETPPGDLEPPAVEPSMPPWGWLGAAVDFSTHAVIVLRGEPQDRWGGGVWLTGIAHEGGQGGGAVVEYAVMVAGDDCPAGEAGAGVQPTVAIRVPLPLTEPVTWRRETYTIACDWDDVTWPSEPPRPGAP